jgi:chorismate-pyruvate lyase
MRRLGAVPTQHQRVAHALIRAARAQAHSRALIEQLLRTTDAVGTTIAAAERQERRSAAMNGSETDK